LVLYSMIRPPIPLSRTWSGLTARPPFSGSVICAPPHSTRRQAARKPPPLHELPADSTRLCCTARGFLICGHTSSRISNTPFLRLKLGKALPFRGASQRLNVSKIPTRTPPRPRATIVSHRRTKMTVARPYSTHRTRPRTGAAARACASRCGLAESWSSAPAPAPTAGSPPRPHPARRPSSA
jgi:hypothetical protein